MQSYLNEKVLESFDVVVIGAGHAGIEAALCSARLKAKTAVFTISLDAIGNMPCNPSIGGTAKSHLVFEIDALGGQMAKAADETKIQTRMLNATKGAAVHSLRSQIDRMKYCSYMKSVLEQTENLFVIQDEVVEILYETNDQTKTVVGIKTSLGGTYLAKAVVVATGTYLGGKIFVGSFEKISGPDGVVAATQLTKSLEQLGLPIRRFKTGTPARVHKRSIDFSAIEKQPPDETELNFCFINNEKPQNKIACHITHTNEKTHQVITENLSRSPLYGGKIEGIGPRYCPSIEDKVVRFPEKPRHSLFIEPCGESTDEMYLQGMSSSLPLDVQYEFYKTIKGLENVEIMRPAYAIEYDCIDPLSLDSSLAVKSVTGLFGAGQFCGTSGYEEAAAQGLIAGINAASFAKGERPFTLSRSSSYIGTLIDDLVTKGVMDPYRMMTSRSEHRLVLRQDNADERLCEIGRNIGLLDDERYSRYLENKAMLESEKERIKKTVLPPSDDLNAVLTAKNSEPIKTGITLEALFRRPEISPKDIADFDKCSDKPPIYITEKAAIHARYEGYIKRQQKLIERQIKQDEKPIPNDIDYNEVLGLSLEARDKLLAVRPKTFGQALRISGVNPGDLSVLAIYLASKRKK